MKQNQADRNLLIIFVVLAGLMAFMMLSGCSTGDTPVYIEQTTPTPTPSPVLTPVSGLSCNVYDLSVLQPANLPIFDSSPSQAIVGSTVAVSQPIASYMITGQVDFTTPQQILAGSGVAQTTWFAVDCTGKFDVTTGNVYSLSLNSDDGSQLLIDNTSIILNNGLHSATSKSASVAITPGTHTIELQYFQGPGQAVLQLYSNLSLEFHQ